MPLNQILELLGGGSLLGANGRPDVDVTALEGKTVALYFRQGIYAYTHIQDLPTVERFAGFALLGLTLSSARGNPDRSL
jgi:hypothetical protein